MFKWNSWFLGTLHSRNAWHLTFDKDSHIPQPVLQWFLCKFIIHKKVQINIFFREYIARTWYNSTAFNSWFFIWQIFPREILEIQQLEILKLRNNPLRELPSDIHRLRNLRILVVSFCLLTNIPMGYCVRSTVKQFFLWT